MSAYAQHIESLFTPPADSLASYDEASHYAQICNITSMRHWFDFHNLSKGGKVRPSNIPGDPSKYYGRSGEWKGWGAFLGTNTTPTISRREQYCTLEEFQALLRREGIDTVAKFRKFCASGNRPDWCPAIPHKTYNLSYAKLIPKGERTIASYAKAKEIMAQFNLIDYRDYRRLRAEHPDTLGCLPGSPDRVYARTGEWEGWAAFLGCSPRRTSRPRARRTKASTNNQ